MRCRLGMIALATTTALAAPARADNLELAAQPFVGRHRFILIGASLTDATGLTNGVNCLESAATATVSRDDVPSRARLVAATLYLGGSLFDDGPDFSDPNRSIFDTGGLSYSTASEQAAIVTLARAAADRQAEIMPPGAAAPVAVSTTGDRPSVTVFYQAPASPGAEGGNIGFFVTPIDVTDVINGQGRGIIDGDYTVSGIDADVCHGLEARCDATQSCSSTGRVHTKGTASFALLLVLEDPSLPQSSIAVFEGLESLFGSFVERTLTLGSPISAPGAGSVALYALEGDLDIGNADASAPCGGQEYLELDGDLDPSAGGLCLADDDNPAGNLFNSTINVQPAEAPDEPGCAPQFGCCGDGRCGETGVDIDRFDVSSSLTAGADRVRVRVGTAADRVALGVLVLSVGVFEPVLEVDSQVRVLTATEDGLVQLGGPVDYSIAISNTGNVDATDVRVFMDGPRFTDGFELLRLPPGGLDLSVPAGGQHGNGLARVEGFSVPAGEIAEVRVRWRSTCDALMQTLDTSAQIAAAETPSFFVAAPPVVVRGPPLPELTDCPEVDAAGPFAEPAPHLGKRLRGGGGCSAAGGLFPALAVLLLLARRRLSPRVLLLLIAGCAERHEEPPPPAAAVRYITSLEGLPGETGRCGTPLMVEVERLDHTRFCIDRFEASLDDGELGDLAQGSSDVDVRTNGSTLAEALVALRLPPAASVSWYQAKAACENAGKRLCSQSEWERACRGRYDLLYPYGDTLDDHACNGFFDYAEEDPQLTGSYATCGSLWGAYDMSGNLEEWVEDATARMPDSTLLEDRVLRGGSFRSNESALKCFGGEFHAPPGEPDSDRGFRCCKGL